MKNEIIEGLTIHVIINLSILEGKVPKVAKIIPV